MYVDVSNRGTMSTNVHAHEGHGGWVVDAHLGVAYLSFDADEARELAALLVTAASHADVANAAATAAREAIAAMETESVVA